MTTKFLIVVLLYIAVVWPSIASGSMCTLDFSKVQNNTITKITDYSQMSTLQVIWTRNGDVAYQLVNYRLIALDTSNLNDIKTAATIPSYTFYQIALSVDEKVLYAAAQKQIVVYDVSSPLTLKVIGMYNLTTQYDTFSTIAVAPNQPYLFATSTYTGLFVFDVSDPTAPELLGNSTGALSLAQAFSMSPDGNYMFSIYALARVFNVTNPVHPVEVSVSLGISCIPKTLLSSQKKWVLFVLCSSDFYILNTTNLLSITIISRFSNSGWNTGTMVLSDDETRAYITTQTADVTVLDISNASNPTYVSSYSAIAQDGLPSTPVSVALAQNVLMLARSFYGLLFLAVQNTHNPYISSTDIISGSNAIVKFSGNKLYATYSSTPDMPSLISYSIDTNFNLQRIAAPPVPGQYIGTTVSSMTINHAGTLAAVCMQAGYLQFVDLSTSLALKSVFCYCTDVVFSSDDAYAVVASTAYYQFYTWTTKSLNNLTQIATTTISTNCRPQKIILDPTDKTLYMLNKASALDLCVFNVSGFGVGTYLGGLKLENGYNAFNSMALAKNAKSLFAVGGFFASFDVSSPANPTVLNYTTPSGWSITLEDIVLVEDDSRAVVAGGPENLLVYNIKDPQHTFPEYALPMLQTISVSVSANGQFIAVGHTGRGVSLLCGLPVATPEATTGSEKGGKHKTSSGSGAVAAAVVVVVVVAAAAVIAAFLIRRRRRQQKANNIEQTDGTYSNGTELTSNNKNSIKLKNTNSITFRGSVDSVTIENVSIREKLGGGNFGEVYKGKWNDVTEVALKKLKSNEDMDDFYREAATIQSLAHPNIVQFLGIYEDKPTGSKYIVTEFLNRGSLDLLLQKEKKRFDLTILLDMALQIVAGLQYLAQKKIVHRDLALRNILVMSKGEEEYQVKVSDFGLSRSVQTSYYKASDNVMPIKWSAPECLEYHQFSLKSDIWSLGIVLWELFSYGKVPYAGIPTGDLFQKILDGYRLPIPIGCPAEVYDMMQKCWMYDPEERTSLKAIQMVIAEQTGLLTKDKPKPQAQVYTERTDEPVYN